MFHVSTLGGVLFSGGTVMSNEFEAISKQIEHFRSNGLKIDDYKEAYDFLLQNNYYRINEYFRVVSEKAEPFKTIAFSDVVSVYKFDHDFRHVILSFIEAIEIKMKSLFVYEFTKKHGQYGYLEKNNFKDFINYEKIMQKVENQKSKSIARDPYLKHYIDELYERIPFGLYVEFFTISDISLLYSISEDDVQKSVALEFGFKSNKASKILVHHLHSMTIIRNICAHGGRIYNRLFERKPSLNRDELSLLVTDSEGNVDNSRFYGFFIIMKRLLSNEDFLALKKLTRSLLENHPHISMGSYGFRADWNDVL